MKKLRSIPVPPGFSPAHVRQYRMMIIRQDLVRVAKSLGKPDGVAPTLVEYERNGRYTAARACKAAGVPRHRWLQTMNAYKMTPSKEARRATVAALVADVRRVARELGRPDVMPAQREYGRLGAYPWSTLYGRLENGMGWCGVASRCGLRMSGCRGLRYRDNASFLFDYRRVAQALGYKPGGVGPSSGEFAAHVEYHPHTASVRFGGKWQHFVTAAGFKARKVGEPRRRKAA